MADVGRELADRELRKLERELAHEYAQAEKELRKKREEFTKEYQKELQKKKALLEKGELTKERYKQWLEQQALYESWVSEMADYMANEQVNANRRAAEIMNNATPKVYAEAFNFGTFLVEDAVGIDTMFALYNADTVARLMKDNPKLLPEANIDVPKDKRWNYQKIKTSLVQSVLQGESVSKMAKRLRRVTDMNKTSAIRNARTMLVGAENSGRFDSFQRVVGLGVEMKKMWSATMDSRTRDSHAALDGETVELNEKFSNGLMYPGDSDGSPSEVYNCRCRLSAQLAGFERNNRHIVDGEQVTEEQYQAWRNAHQTTQSLKSANVTTSWFPTGERFSIDSIIRRNGFDGKPQVVNGNDFTKIAIENGNIGVRGIKGQTQEVVDKFYDELLNGKFYVNCEYGGSAYGRGMYSAINRNDGTLTDRMKEVASSYSRHFEGQGGRVITFTTTKDFKWIDYIDVERRFNEVCTDDLKEMRGKALLNKIKRETQLTEKEVEYIGARYLDLEDRNSILKWWNGKSDEEKKAIDSKVREQLRKFSKKNGGREDFSTFLKMRESIDLKHASLDVGEKAAILGYDGIYVESQGYGIILNRTKLIIRGGK